MINKFLKIFSIFILLSGLIAIMVIKNISAEKQKYINQLELSLREEQEKNQLYQIEWEHMISPLNLKKISEMILTNDYTKYFVVLDKDEIDKNNNSFQDIIYILTHKMRFGIISKCFKERFNYGKFNKTHSTETKLERPSYDGCR